MDVKSFIKLTPDASFRYFAKMPELKFTNCLTIHLSSFLMLGYLNNSILALKVVITLEIRYPYPNNDYKKILSRFVNTKLTTENIGLK
jgi:hypothetical protein